MTNAILGPNDIQSFIENGFVRIDEAFSQATANECREILWKATGCNPADRATWTRPVIRLGHFADRPFQDAANSPRLTAAFDQLIGAGRWIPRDGLGTFPIRFPSPEDPGDTGWHVDASFPPAHQQAPLNFLEWRVNVSSRGRALLMLFLFSDVGERDAPTRIRVASHLDVARILAPAGDEGLSCMELAGCLDATTHRREVLATGPAGAVYLCHSLLVHAAQPHRGVEPRFMAQPPLVLKQPMQFVRADGDYSPAEAAIRQALGFESAD